MSSDDTFIGRKIKHHRFGEGVISQIRYKGAEYYIKFQNKLNTWVKAAVVEISPDNLEPKTSVTSMEATESIPQSSNEFKARRMIEAFRMGIVPFFDVENFTFGRNA